MVEIPSLRPSSMLDRPFLPLGQQMHGAEPHPHRQLGALEDGAGDQRCLVAADPTLQQLTLADLAILFGRAPRTLEALRPAPGEPHLPTGVFIRIELLERVILEALLVLHAVVRHRFDPENRQSFRKIILHAWLIVDGKQEGRYG